MGGGSCTSSPWQGRLHALWKLPKSAMSEPALPVLVPRAPRLELAGVGEVVAWRRKDGHRPTLLAAEGRDSKGEGSVLDTEEWEC